MIRAVCALSAALFLGGPFALLWWAFDEDGSSPFWLLFIVGWCAYALWPEPRPVRRRTRLPRT
ncbi:MAG TPA: hypothetical protein VLC10_03695 [Patescibacteria group bacterium]|nr:hypothetical protein [Patescibacteria group bacterium]